MPVSEDIDLFAPPSASESHKQNCVAQRIQRLREALGDDAMRYGPDELSQLARDDAMFQRIVNPQ